MSPRPKRMTPMLAKPKITKPGKPAPVVPKKPAAPSNRQVRRAVEAAAHKHKPGASPVQQGSELKGKKSRARS
jgi:hypothetical protein